MSEPQLTAMFCDIDDFCKRVAPISHRHLLQAGHRHRRRQTALALSEILTILVSFHSSHDRTFKPYYTEDVAARLRPYVPPLVSATRFVEGLPIMLFGCLDQVEFHVAAQVVRGAELCKVHCNALLHGGCGEPPRDASAIGCADQLFPGLGQVIRAVWRWGRSHWQSRETSDSMLLGFCMAVQPEVRTKRSAFVEAILERFPLLPVDPATARAHAQVWATLAAAGTLIGPHDLWLAATCIAHGLAMVTANIREFTRVPGLAVEVWGGPV